MYRVTCVGPTIRTVIKCDTFEAATTEFIEHIKMGYPTVALERIDESSRTGKATVFGEYHKEQL